MFNDISVVFTKVGPSVEDIDGCFETPEGMFYYKVDMSAEDFRISDSIGRHVIIDVPSLRDLKTIIDLAIVRYEETDWLDSAIVDTLRRKGMPTIDD